MTAKKQPTQPSFEQELTTLEELAERMESGNLPLDDLLQAYEEGMTLAKALQTRLERARAKLNEVKPQKDGSISVTPSTAIVQGSLLDELEP